MIYVFYTLIALGMMVFATTIAPHSALLANFYDPLALLVVYLGFFRPVREGLPFVLALGVVMDTLTGGIIGLYLTTYIWLYIGVAWLRTFMRVGNHLLLPIVVVAGVLIQNGVFLGYVTLLAPNTQVPRAAGSTVIAQLIWVFITGPFALAFFNFAHQRWESWRRDILAEQSGPAEGKMLDSTSLASAERRTTVSRSGR